MGRSFQIPETLVALLEARANTSADAVAYIYLRDGRTEDGRISYGELDRRARAMAATLQSRGVRSGDRALLLFPAGLDVSVALFGCLYAGVIAVPAPAPEGNRAARALPRLKAIADDAQATVLISCTRILAALNDARTTEGSLGPVKIVDATRVEEALAAAWCRPAISGDTLAYLQYTSGSTSAPRGACISHAQLLCHLTAMNNHRGGYTPECVTVNWMPYFHDYGLIEGLLLPLFTGTRCVLMSPYALIKQPLNWLLAISRYRATHSHAPNFAYAHCTRRIDATRLPELDLSCWQYAGIGAEPINPEMMAEFARTFATTGFRHESFYPGYGLAEATLAVTQNALANAPRVGRFDRRALEQGQARAGAPSAPTKDTRAIVSCGCSLDGTTVAIVDPRTRARASDNAVGEIWVSSPAIARGYWQRDDVTAETFQAHTDIGEGPFLRTGDLGFLCGGELYVCGRLKDLIIIRGQNVAPQDIEWTVQQAHSALKPDSGAAFSVEIDGEERLVVVQEIQGKLLRDLDAPAVFAAVRAAIGEVHGFDLHAVVLLRPGTLSKTSSGKVRRSACRTMFLDGTLNAVQTWRQPLEIGKPTLDLPVADGPTETAIRDFVVQRVAAAVGQPAAAIEPREPFARFGLNSVQAVTLVGELEAWLGLELPATLAFDYPNAEAIARHLSANGRGGPAGEPSTRPAKQHIAVVGIGCRFPGGINGPQHFWEALRAGFDGVREVPSQRWDVDAWYAREPGTPGKMNTRWGGFVDDVDAFDAGFFAISPREARLVDPQQRMLLEVSWEALEHAGIAAERLAGSRTGVFVGICSNDYQRLQSTTAHLQEGYAATGNALSIAANRISYTLDLVGPSWAVDTACSSSLVAVHQACRSLRAGEADLALAGGVNLVLDPAPTVAFSQSRMMSPTGRCRTFSDDADGYVRAEGCGVIVLKRLVDAERDGDRVIAVIRGSAVNQDGRSNGLTAPSGPSQRTVVRAALADAGVAPAEVGYVEAHGTGTPLGDPIELNALAEVLGEGRAADNRCWVGSVKSNFGHLEAAAGIAGLIKAALCVERGEVPRNLHFRALNPHIRIEGSGVDVPLGTERWANATQTRIAGVSSFGFGGTNAHVIVAAPRDAKPAPAGPMRSLHLLCASARTKEALDTLLQAYAQRLRVLPQELVGDFCFTINAGRSAFPYRAAVVGASSVELADAIARMARPGALANDPRAAYGKATAKSAPLMFYFGDLRAVDPGMGAELYRTSPAFAQAVERCIGYLDEVDAQGLRGVFSGASADHAAPTHRLQALHALALQYASWALWQSWGIRADEVSGEGRGMLAAACARGALSLEAALRLCGADAASDPHWALANLPRTAPDGALAVTAGAAETPFERALLKHLLGIGATSAAQREGAVWMEIGPRAGNATCSAPAGTLLLPGFEGTSAWDALLSALGRLFVAGVSADWPRFDAPYARRRIDAPTYPFQRERYWFQQATDGGAIRVPAAFDGPGSRGARSEAGDSGTPPAFGTAAHLDWLASELARLEPSKRGKLLEWFLDDKRPRTKRGPRVEESPLSSADIRGLSDEEAEALLRRRLESLNY